MNLDSGYNCRMINKRYLPTAPPSNAVDENAASQWSAEQDAPQWIEIDLNQPYLISEILLLVAQWPEGQTVHRLSGGSDSGSLVELTTFSQSTQGGIG